MKENVLLSVVSIGKRIQVMGNSCAGKSTLATELAELFGVTCIDLDALNWEPNWVSVAATNPTEFKRRLRQATAGEAWIVAGSYAKYSQDSFWERLDTVIWIDLPLWQLVGRVLKRSWQRWRSKELLWGTNYEKFWPQLMMWKKKESLLYWIVTQYRPKNRAMLSYMMQPQWRHIRFIRLTSSQEVKLFMQTLRQSVRTQPTCSIPQNGEPLTKI
jgi:adenylate kinase family enzyme